MQTVKRALGCKMLIRNQGLAREWRGSWTGAAVQAWQSLRLGQPHSELWSQCHLSVAWWKWPIPGDARPLHSGGCC